MTDSLIQTNEGPSLGRVDWWIDDRQPEDVNNFWPRLTACCMALNQRGPSAHAVSEFGPGKRITYLLSLSIRLSAACARGRPVPSPSEALSARRC